MSVDTEQSKVDRGIQRTVVILVAVMAAFLALFFHKLMSPRILNSQELSANGTVVFEKPRIMKEFALVDQSGQAFTLDNLKGHWTLLYFGFTNCPDICPSTLAILSQWYKKLNDDIRENTQVVLVSVDPERDTTEVLSQYMNHFNSDFIGLTGELASVESLTDQVHVGFNKVPMGDDYTVDHSGHIALINPYGHFHGFFKPPFEMARLKLTYQSVVSSF